MCKTNGLCACPELTNRPDYRMKSWPLQASTAGLREALRKPKELRFADAEGLPLVSVLSYWESDCVDDLLTVKAGHRRRSAPCYHLSLLSDVDDFLGSLHVGENVPSTPIHREVSRKELVFDDGRHVSAEEAVSMCERQQVCLESVSVHGLTVFGAVRVRNLAYDKAVTLRYTTDGWRTHCDLEASYVHGSSDGRTDRFSFTLVLPDTTPAETRFEFAVSYRSDGGDFWDNNDGKNFSATCRQVITSVPQQGRRHTHIPSVRRSPLIPPRFRPAEFRSAVRQSAPIAV